MTVVAMSTLLNENGVGHQVFAACDQMLSGDMATVHLPYSKVERVAPTWILGYAGIPSHYFQVKHPVSELLKADPAMGSGSVVATLKEAYQSLRRREIEDSILSSYGLKMDEFVASGPARLGKRFKGLCADIEEFDLGIWFLLAGWTPGENTSIIIEVSNPGVAYDHSLEGASAIGMGAPIAMGHLHACHNIREGTRPALYRLLEAKFMSEAARSVGPDTVLLQLDDIGLSWFSNENCEAFRELWKARRTEIPDQIASKLQPVRL